MSSAEESPAQKAARLRRERREAKIKDGGAARLDKITSLSGRTPAPHEEVSPSPSPSPRPPGSVSPAPPPGPNPGINTSLPPSSRASPVAQDQSAETLQAQQDFIRSLLRQGPPEQQQQGQGQGPGGQQGFDEEDPTMKLLNSLMAGGGMPGGPGPGQGGGGDGGDASGAPPAITPDLLSALGLPPFLANMIGAAMGPSSEEDKREIWTWKILHVIFTVVVAGYLLVLIGSSVATYGSPPPPPATARNPFLFFTTGEVLLSGARIGMRTRTGGRAGLGMWVQLVRDVVRDGSLVLFLLGLGTWWNRGWLAY